MVYYSLSVFGEPDAVTAIETFREAVRSRHYSHSRATIRKIFLPQNLEKHEQKTNYERQS